MSERVRRCRTTTRRRRKTTRNARCGVTTHPDETRKFALRRDAQPPTADRRERDFVTTTRARVVPTRRGELEHNNVLLVFSSCHFSLKFGAVCKITDGPHTIVLDADARRRPMATLDADEYALDELTCPITGEIYVDPVLCVGDGHTYERHAATRWLATHTTSPLTGEQMQPEGMRLVDNHLVRKQAAAVLRRRPELHPTWPDPANATPSAPPLGPALGRDFGQNDCGQKSDSRYGTDGAATARETPHDSSRVPVPYVCIAGTGVATRDKKKLHPLRVFSVFPLKPAPRWERVGAGCSGDGFLACSRDGALLACGAQNSSVVTAWRPEFSSPSVTFEPGTRINPTARPPVTADAADDWVLCGAVAPNAAWVCAAGRGEFVHVWRVDGTCLGKVSSFVHNPVY